MRIPETGVVASTGQWGAPSIGVDALISAVRRLHPSQDDLQHGDIIHRIERFRAYELRQLAVAELKLAEWAISEELVAEYAVRTELAPPIVYDPIAGSIIDGTHRANAAYLRGEAVIAAYVGVDPDPDWDDAEPGE